MAHGMHIAAALLVEQQDKSLSLQKGVVDMARSDNDSENDRRGFASMDDEKQREIASQGGRSAHQSAHAHEFDPGEAREAGRKGGDAVSQDRQHMSEIGEKGGEAVSADREHMSEIGRKGGERRGTDSSR